MYASVRTYVREDDSIEIEQNTVESDRAAIYIWSASRAHDFAVGLTDDRLAELRDKIDAYLSAKQSGRTDEDGECPSGLQIQHDGVSCADAHSLI